MLENLSTSKVGRDFIEGFEGCVLYVYDDKCAPVGGKYREWDGGHVVGTLTIGYGHTNEAKHPLKCTHGLRITKEQADEILGVDLDDVENDVRKYVKVPIDQGQWDALVSFDFNCGPGNLKKLVAPLNAGDAQRTRAAFDYYIRSKGTVMRGLQRRRDGEQALWDSHPAVQTHIPDWQTEVVHHPAEVDAKPNVVVTAAKSRKVWAGLTAKVAAVGGILTNGAHNLVNHYFHSPLPPADYIQHIDVEGFMSDVQPKIEAGQQIAGWLNMNVTTISAVIVVACLAFMILQGAKDKQDAQV